MTFYTYLWLRETNGKFPAGTPYYAGKGTGYRAFVARDHRFTPPKNKECILIQEFPDEASAFEGEKFLICMYGRVDQGTGCLRNLTDGGEGAAGHVFSSTSRARMAAAGKGRKFTPQHCANIAAAKRGTPGSRKGKKASLDTCAKIAVSKIGNKNAKGCSRSLEFRENLSKLRKGNTLFLGKHHSVATKKAISAARKEYWKQRRNLNENLDN